MAGSVGSWGLSRNCPQPTKELKVTDERQYTSTSFPLDQTTLKGHSSCRAPGGIHHGLCCIVVQLFPCAVWLPSLPCRCWCWEHSSVKVLLANLHLRVCPPGNPMKTGDYFSVSLWLIQGLKGVKTENSRLAPEAHRLDVGWTKSQLSLACCDCLLMARGTFPALSCFLFNAWSSLKPPWDWKMREVLSLSLFEITLTVGGRESTWQSSASWMWQGPGWHSGRERGWKRKPLLHAKKLNREALPQGRGYYRAGSAQKREETRIMTFSSPIPRGGWEKCEMGSRRT